MNETTHIIAQDDALRFITAGNCTFTLKSLITGRHITYKAVYSEYYGKSRIYVKYLNGSDNETSYQHLCMIEKEGFPKLIKGGKVSPEQLSWKSFRYVFNMLLMGEFMTQLEIWHSGTCGRCGRKLTVPESIASGYGPECIGKVNKFEI